MGLFSLSSFQWMPSVEQVQGTLPYAFHEKYSETHTIIDASEVTWGLVSMAVRNLISTSPNGGS